MSMLEQVTTTSEEPALITGQPEPHLDDLALFGRHLAESHRQDTPVLQAAQVSREKASHRPVAPRGGARPVSERISQFSKLMKEAASRLHIQTSPSGELTTAAEWL